MAKIKFPQDELPHNHSIEWWYFNGHLRDEKDQSYAFMNCLFRAKTKEAKIPLLSRVPRPMIYFSHSLLFDFKNQRSYPVTDYLSVVSRDSFSRSHFFVNYANPILVGGYFNRIIEATGPFQYHLKNDYLDLVMKSKKEPLLVGGDGQVKLGSRSTYYYSLTNLETQGEMRLGKRIIAVKGQSWLDHQWADVSYVGDYWTWFSLQLDNRVEILCFEYNDGKNKYYLASLIDASGRQQHVRDFILTPLKINWRSPETKAVYQLSWQIEIVEYQIKLTVTPLIKKQEMVFGKINYWEGPLSVSGTFGGRSVNGLGFLELVGRPSHYNNLHLIKDFAAKIKKIQKSFYHDYRL